MKGGIDGLIARIEAKGKAPVWIDLFEKDDIAHRAAAIERRKLAGETVPLYGKTFAVKDNIDVAGRMTTAGCPDFAYRADGSATVVAKLEAAGALLVGKTNLDQFATGLVGTRSPYGACASVYDDRYISGGSSSGSAVAVAAGLVDFALGTDTAGSGRVPAAFNNLVGLKPTKGLISTAGLVPACRSLDCISIFARSVAEALAVLRAGGGYDAADPYSRRAPDPAIPATPLPRPFRFGVPEAPLEFFGDAEAAALYALALARLKALGGEQVAIDFSPFAEAARLLYAGPWVAERRAALGDFALLHPDSIHPVVREIILGADGLSAVSAFEGFYRLAEFIRQAEAEWARMDVLVLPTAPTTYTIEEVEADPIRLNARLGLYTNFVNLMDLSALAVPAGFRINNLPFGITFVGPAFADGALAVLGGLFLGEGPDGAPTGALAGAPAGEPAAPGKIRLAVVGAHLSGQPLNGQLTGRGARLVATRRTAPGYRLWALAGAMPAKPGLVRDPTAAGGIEVEIWEMDPAGFGTFVAAIPPPLGIGTLDLADGTRVKGFLCDSEGVRGGEDITDYGGWRAWLAR